MENKCEWCESQNIIRKNESVYWELPDGTRAIEISETPTIACLDCQIYYQPEDVVRKIEDQLLLIDTKQLRKKITFHELLSLPRLLKKNYFDFHK